MSKKPQQRTKHPPARTPVTKAKSAEVKQRPLFYWMLLAAGVTAICFSPMLKNGFTNWDDELYVLKNLLLRGPDWKGIFTEPVVGNYHPLTIITLAVNYHLTGLDASSYLLFNYILHIANTVLVFYFVWIISGKNRWVALFTALLFGIHPMHVESVAWISERKDVLYTLFFLPSLIFYWSYLQGKKATAYFLCLVFFILSLLSKPAAVILPLVLFLLDYLKGRTFTLRSVLEKVPFLLFSLAFGIITVMIQSESAIAGLDMYPAWARLLFPCYVLMTYFIRFIIPYPLSAFHPYPQMADMGWAVIISPLFILALTFFLWRFRKDRTAVFGILFYLVNLVLVLQVLSIGLTIVSERYTYVPYIGLAFTAGMWISRIGKRSYQQAGWAAGGILLIVFGVMTFQRTTVWKNSGTLWSDVIGHYPGAPVPHSNRADYIQKELIEGKIPRQQADTLIRRSLEDCGIALSREPNFAKPYQTRALLFLWLNRFQEALEDAATYIRLKPDSYLGYSIRGIAYYRLNLPREAVDDFTKSLLLNPDDDVSLNYRGSAFFNSFQKYDEALADFNQAIRIKPQGNYFLNRSHAHYMLGDLGDARADVDSALFYGETVPEEYRKMLNP